MSSLEVGQRVECVFASRNEQRFVGQRGFVIGLVTQKMYGQVYIWYRVEFDIGERRQGIRQCWKPIEPRTDDSWVKTRWEDCPWQPVHIRFNDMSKKLMNGVVYTGSKDSV